MKKNPTAWTSTIEDEELDFAYEIVQREHVLTVNSARHTFPVGFLDMFGIDQPFSLNGRETQLVVSNGKADVVMNGVFLRSGKVYVPRPSWVWIFAGLCLLPPIVNFGGAIPALFGFLEAWLCIRASTLPFSAVCRMLLCALAAATTWAAWMFSAVALTMLLNE